MKEYRCKSCHSLLFKGQFIGKIEIMCKKCKKIKEIECLEHQSSK